MSGRPTGSTGAREGPTRERSLARAVSRLEGSAGIAGLCLALALCSGACHDDLEARRERRDPDGATRTTDLLDKGDAEAPKVIVEEFDGDFRPTWVMRLADRFSIALDLAGRDCEVRVGLRAKAGGRARGKRILAQVRQRTKDGGRRLFEAELIALPGNEGAWRDHRFRIPVAEGDTPGPVELVFGGERADGGSPEGITIGWSAPYSVCPTSPIVRLPAPARPHVVLISIDTLRADHMSLYGYRRETTPFLDRFARQAFVFDRAFSTAPWTAPSHASIFTGLYPEQHRAGHADPFAALPDDVETMAEILRRNGYRTLGFTAGGVMGPASGLGQGFDRYESRARARLDSYLPAVLEEVERHAGESLFLFLHTYDVHGPYIQPRGMRSFTADAEDPRVDDAEWARLRRPGPHDYLRLELFDGLEDVVAAYDSGIHFADREVEALFGALRATGLLDHALVIVTSDHGEVLYDRALYIGHTFTLHDEVLRVPLIVKRVGQESGARIEALTDSTDILPMVLDEVGIDRPDGRSGRNPLLADDAEKPFVRGEAAHTGATYIRDRRFKVITAIRDFDDPRSQVPGPLRDRIARGGQWFDLVDDPRELENRRRDATRDDTGATRDEADAPYRELTSRLDRELGNAAGPDVEGGRDLTDAERAELRSLGYVD